MFVTCFAWMPLFRLQTIYNIQKELVSSFLVLFIDTSIHHILFSAHILLDHPSLPIVEAT